jgi:hypothetical protein
MLAPALPVDPRAYPAPVTRALAPVAAVAIVAAASDPAERDFIATLAGRTVAAMVVGRSDNGRAIVAIAGRQVAVSAALPAPGSSVLLSFGDADPAATPREAMPGAANPRDAAPAATPPGLQAALKATRELRESAAGSPATSQAQGAVRGGAVVDIRPQALLLGRLADDSTEPRQLGRVEAPIAAPAEWAKALGTLVQDSGTFYESHLAAWTQGQYPLAQIRHEPQAAPRQPGEAVAAPAPEAEAGMRQPAAPAAAGAAVSGVPDEWRPVVREQLHTLETRSLPFTIEAWPGQRADIVIAGEREAQSGPAADRAPAWNTSLKLTLPRLGEIDAALSLRGDRLWLELAVPSASADELDAASSALTHAMAAAGLQMARVRVLDRIAPADAAAPADGAAQP